MSDMPGGELATRPLHFFWIADCSGSMASDSKIQSLNNAIRESLPHMKKVADGNPNAQVLVRALAFSSGAKWHIPPTNIDDFNWLDLHAGGVTDLGKALKMVAQELKMPPMPERALPPVLVLISDGQPTDNWEEGLSELMKERWGSKAVRIAISIGHDADLDCLKQFIGNSEMEPLQANNAQDLVTYIRWASTAVLQAASAPASQSSTGNSSTGNVMIPQVPTASSSENDVW